MFNVEANSVRWVGLGETQHQIIFMSHACKIFQMIFEIIQFERQQFRPFENNSLCDQ
jgi:hypothetical protein